MRRQRISDNLPTEDDLSPLHDSESESVFSMPYSYPETIWNQVISPELESFIPQYIYQYPCSEISDELPRSVPCFFYPPLTATSFSALDAISHYNDGNCGFISESFCCDTSYGDGIIPGEEWNKADSSHDKSLTHETVGEFSLGLPTAYPFVTSYGTVTILLRHLVRIDISIKKAMYITNPPGCYVAVINGVGDKSCIIHPNGKVLLDREEIHMTTLNRKAKITSRGVLFTSTDLCLSYLVDASGTKTATEKFKNLNHDFSLEVFYDSAIENDVDKCHRMVNESTYSYWNGDEVWDLGGFHVKQNRVGDIKVTRNGDMYFIRSSPTTGQVTMKTFQGQIAIGRYPDNYFTIRKGDKKITATVKEFIIQNGSQKAGINNLGEVTLF